MTAGADAAIEGYWQSLRTEAHRWLDRAGIDEHLFAIAGHQVTLRFAGSALGASIAPALGHLSKPSASASEPDLTVVIADGTTTGRPLPAPPVSVPDGEAWMLRTPRLAALHLPALGSVLWFDRERQCAIYWLPDAASVPIAERGSPLLTLFDWWLSDRDLQLTHAAAIGTSSGAALLVGRGGSGKSTTALTCLGAPPLLYLADDYCVVSPDETPTVHSLYCSGKVNAGDDSRFTRLRSSRVGSDQEKHLYVFHPSQASHLATCLPLRMILLPTITGRPETTTSPVSAMEALRAVAPSTVLQLRAGVDPAAALKRLADVARRVPCLRLELGAELERIPQVLAGLLA